MSNRITYNLWSNGGGCLTMATGQANAEIQEDLAPTLVAGHEHPIVFENHSQDSRYNPMKDVCQTLSSQLGTGGNNQRLVVATSERPTLFDGQRRHNYAEMGDVCETIQAQYGTGGGNTPLSVAAYREDSPVVKSVRWIVRRLTMTEAERLQGFPDGWTDLGEWTDTKGKKHKPSMSNRYKALGNSICLPQWWWLTQKMAAYLPEHATLGSLFDGIGGFPLVWEEGYGKGTARWASEIEEFPIAVTKRHFPEETPKRSLMDQIADIFKE